MSESLKLQVPAHLGIAATRDDQLPLKVVDGLAQVYKTPLTVILAASAGLSENACKYSAIGSTIKIVAVRMNSEVMISVHNSGPVIPVEDREYIFEQYSLPSSLTNRISNSGFGLLLAKRIASLHGGRVWVTSSEPEGTAFFVSIPTSVPERCSP